MCQFYTQVTQALNVNYKTSFVQETKLATMKYVLCMHIHVSSSWCVLCTHMLVSAASFLSSGVAV